MKSAVRRSVALVLALLVLCSACSRQGSTSSAGGSGTSSPASSSASGSASGSASEPEEPAPPPPPPEPIVAHIMAGGDVMCHMPITNDAYIAETDSYDYSHMFTDVTEQVQQADYAIANLETPLAGGPNYSGYPHFNAPDAFAYDIKEAGFDMVSTANNHSRDQKMDGLFRTLDVLDEVGLAHVGTYRTQEERDAQSGIVVADVNGISMAVLCYTYGLNGYKLDDDKLFAANLFNSDYYTTLVTPNYDLLNADMEAARALNTDLITVLIHWGLEYRDQPTDYQREMATYFVEQGADIIIGNHPHVIEPYETITATGLDGTEREGFVIYSLGNLISNQYESNQQQDTARRTTAILDLEVTKDFEAGETKVTDICYTPYFMIHHDSAPVGQRRTLVNVHEGMAAYEAGDTSEISANDYAGLQRALDRCHTLLGEESDRGPLDRTQTGTTTEVTPDTSAATSADTSVDSSADTLAAGSGEGASSTVS